MSAVLSQAKYSLCVVAAFVCIQLSVLKASEVKKNLILIELGKLNLILLRE
jgi:hypothetical protein